MPPFRWDLVTRSGDAQLVFVGRSLDSMYDLLSGAIPDRVTRLPLSFAGFTQAHTPQALARQAVTFVDVVSRGGTFEALFSLLDNWIVDTREPWDVVRRQLRFVGVTVQGKTSPNTWRWQQHADWTARLPARAVQNVSLHYPVWTYFGDRQTKLTRSFRPATWYADTEGPGRGDRTRHALAEAVALVRYGRGRDGRRALARAVGGEPALGETWLRTLVTGLGR